MEKDLAIMYKKKSPDIFLEPFKKALSFFPELHDTYVFVHETHLFGVQHTLRAYPPLTVLHWRKSKWVYPIVINKNKGINISFYDLTKEQQIGAFAHELSHIITYASFSRRDILGFSVKYAIDKEFVRKIEKETDLEVIKRGAGIYLLEGRIELLNFRLKNPYPETEDTYIMFDKIIENLKRYPDLYSKENIEIESQKIEKIKEEVKDMELPKRVSISRKLKHTYKTVFGFIPEFIKMFYVVTIKKSHSK